MAVSPSTDNYTLGKGIVYFDQKVSGAYTGERDLGNAPAFSFNIALEKLEHFSSRGGLKAKDKSVISQVTPTLTFTLDEINKENIALLTLGTTTAIPTGTGTVTDEAAVVKLGMRTVLAHRGIDVASVVVADAATGLVTYVEGTDYEINVDLKDDVIGRILWLAGGTVVEDEAVEITYDYDSPAYTEINALKDTVIEGRLRFVSDNPAGTQQELEVWRVSLTPSGDTALIGDDWSTLAFSGEVLKDAVLHPESPYMTIRIV